MADEWTCVRCARPMEEGFIPESGNMGLEPGPSQWVEGKPETSFWSGLKTDGRARYKVSALRCASCGRLELFAREPSEG